MGNVPNHSAQVDSSKAPTSATCKPDKMQKAEKARPPGPLAD